jgi:glyoxylase-like metal-dependent hydrolase (beta-lactamase superfamily II)
LLITYHGKRLLLDAGENWAGRIGELEPDGIAITHAHPDHAFGLRDGTERPVYAMQETCAILARFELRRLRVMIPGVAYRLGPFRILAYRVVHSIRAPAVGFRIRVGRSTTTCPRAGRRRRRSHRRLRRVGTPVTSPGLRHNGA